MRLNPSRLGMLARKQRYQEMAEELHLNTCFECGCCGYVCPANIPLVQYFRVAKQWNRERKVRECRL
jgi:electron transport complex protein RnfC